MKKLSLKWAGIIAMICSPGLWLESFFYDEVHHQNTSIGGVFDLLYMTGWMCSIYGLMQLRAAGVKRAGRMILYIQMALLAVASIWNIWEIIDPTSAHPLFRILDMFWPVSNVFMIVTGIAVSVANRLPGYHRFVPLMAGLWVGITFAVFTIFNGIRASFYIMNIYSATAWLLMGFVIYQNRKSKIIAAAAYKPIQHKKEMPVEIADYV